MRLQQEFFLGVLAVYGATVAFGRWFPDTELIAVDAHPTSYATTLKNSSETSLQLYAASLVVDVVRVLALAVLESAAFSFAFPNEQLEAFSYIFLGFSMIMVTKDVLMLGAVWSLPEVPIQAAEKVAELMPVSVMIEQGLMIIGAILLAYGLHQWMFAIGRDKRQVIEKQKTN